MNGRILPDGCPRTAHRPFDLHGLKTYDLSSRPSKVFVEDLGRPVEADVTVRDWLDSLPCQLGARDLRRVCAHLCRAQSRSASTSVRV